MTARPGKGASMRNEFFVVNVDDERAKARIFVDAVLDVFDYHTTLDHDKSWKIDKHVVYADEDDLRNMCMEFVALGIEFSWGNLERSDIFGTEEAE